MRYLTPEQLMQGRFKNVDPPKWKIAILCFRDLQGSHQMLEEFNGHPVGRKVMYGLDEFAAAPFVYETTVAGEAVGILTRLLWGGPQAAIMVEELAHLGVQYIIGCGAAGSLDLNLPRETQVVAITAPAIDGTSRSYAKPGEVLHANPGLAELVANAASDLGGIEEVPVGTIDALYRETEELVAGLRADGLRAINMETAALYAASRACGVKSVWIGHISDCLIDGEWHDWSIDRRQTSRTTATICLRTIEQLVSNSVEESVG